MGMWQEFRKFAIKGNAIDMAVGIIIGAGFTKIVNSLVNDVIMPPIGLMVGNVDFTDKMYVLREATGDATAVTLNYGNFLSTVLDFLIVAFVIFLVIKRANKLFLDPQPPPTPSEKECPQCCTKIPIKAARCPNCTSELAVAG